MQLTGNISDYFIVFWAGILVSFTPCVYPLLPITAGFVAGVNPQGSKAKGLFISLLYVLGIALTYSLLAVFAALTGKIFGQFQNHPVVYFSVAAVLIVFALTMFDIIQIPTIGINIQDRIKKKNVWTIILFGMAAGLVIGPCTAPILGTLLLYIASKQNIIHAVSLMFLFAYGIGASLILVGTFTGILSNLPKSGAWMMRIKQIGGVVLLLAAAYFLLQAKELIIVEAG